MVHLVGAADLPAVAHQKQIGHLILEGPGPTARSLPRDLALLAFLASPGQKGGTRGQVGVRSDGVGIRVGRQGTLGWSAPKAPATAAEGLLANLLMEVSNHDWHVPSRAMSLGSSSWKKTT